ncbi:MAG TPA: glycosyltransferase, partial [Gammaproteobacteria bacterium]|nr:glycosyltransferase [Gammaproteobacteria bacterium]
LDAHWCCADATAGSDSQTPLLEELQAIGSLQPSSVLLIDDARLYLSSPPEPHRLADWPDFHAVVLALLALSQQHRLMVYNDVIIFYPQALRSELSDYTHKHGRDLLRIMRDARKQGRRSGHWWRLS